MTFKDLQLIDPLLKAIEKANYKVPTSIQQQTIPLILKGNDVMGCAQTGTGKTAAFILPILQNLSIRKKQSKKPRALVLTPTRELALQISDNLKTYSIFLNSSYATIFGGVSAVPQIDKLKKGCEILVATPGRLIDLTNQKIIDLREIEILVLDEADQMLDMGFVNDIKKILKNIPTKRQTLFFSATMPTEIKKFANSILYNPKEVIANKVSSTVEIIEQKVCFVEKPKKPQALLHILQNIEQDKFIVFTRTKYGADKLVKFLKKNGIDSVAIHGNKSQNARQNALENFKNDKIKILIATDIAARGIDISELPCVINYELPNVAETYVHRIGRTGRAGKEGIAISFCSTEEQTDLKNIQKLIGFKLKELNIDLI
ncbi:DEAD/DEAH box helicase [Flavobacterium sp. xlx-214]|uniref:DEAD/DEAH box helicase n=1 Tax=unclassified Flavobacterium TaxID=196869 RepID=UPI0013D50B8B|nr:MULTISPECIES: DEAD/DEAH box helicase [unclassified Flavobacterium]MBA5793219.1 DEAD/DEAH box helicase [Flavobacterium sp. xlx-221]QMI82498.1 DEAD/DEAH box helicase [Flavobacterium sp. xlx-214]